MATETHNTKGVGLASQELLRRFRLWTFPVLQLLASRKMSAQRGANYERNHLRKDGPSIFTVLSTVVPEV